MADCFQSFTRCLAWIFGIQIHEIENNGYSSSDEEYGDCTPESCVYARNVEELNKMLDAIKDEHQRMVAEVDWYLAKQRQETDQMREKSVEASEYDSEDSYEEYSSASEHMPSPYTLVPYE